MLLTAVLPHRTSFLSRQPLSFVLPQVGLKRPKEKKRKRYLKPFPCSGRGLELEFGLHPGYRRSRCKDRGARSPGAVRRWRRRASRRVTRGEALFAAGGRSRAPEPARCGLEKARGGAEVRAVGAGASRRREKETAA